MPYAIGTNDVETIKLWERGVEVETARKSLFLNNAHGFMGSTPSSLVQQKDDMAKRGGDRLRVILAQQLKGRGKTGSDQLQGFEEALRTGEFDFLINTLRHAVGVEGEITEQRIPFDAMQTARDLLSDWKAARIDASVFCHLAGFSAPATSVYTDTGGGEIDGSDLAYTGNNAVVTVDEASIVRAGGGANDGAITNTDLFTLDLVDTAVTKAKLRRLPLRPVRFKGWSMPVFVLFLHTYQVNQLRADGSMWSDINRDILKGGGIKDNPILTGALGVYNNTVLIESTYVPPGIHSGAAVANTRRAVLCGAQSMVIGWGRKYNGANKFAYARETEDYGDKNYVATKTIFGCAAPYYTIEGAARSLGRIVIPTYAADITV